MAKGRPMTKLKSFKGSIYKNNKKIELSVDDVCGDRLMLKYGSLVDVLSLTDIERLMKEFSKARGIIEKNMTILCRLDRDSI